MIDRASGDGRPSVRGRIGRRAIVAITAVALLTAGLTLYRLGAADVCSGNEAVEGVFVQRMVEHGEFLFPLENGRTPMYKPPLFHWTAAGLARLFGVTKVTPFLLRSPSALYAVAGVVMTMAFAAAILGARGALLAGLTLAGSYQFIDQGRFGRVDMALAFFEGLALLSFLWWLSVRDRRAEGEGKFPSGEGKLYLTAVALGCAVLAKGPVGLLIPVVAIIGFLALQRRLGVIFRARTAWPALVCLTIASSWYLACYVGGRFGFLDRQIGSENFGRFFGALGAMAPWYYVKPLLLNSAPLSLMVPLAVVSALRGGKPLERATPSSSDPARVAARLLAVFWIVTVVFFSLAAYKRRAYLLPLWPAAAVLLAWWIEDRIAPHWGRIVPRAYAALCFGLVVFNFWYIPHKEILACAGDSYRPAAREINRIVGPGERLFTYGFREDLAPLLFYLDRDAPPIRGMLGDAPPGYIIVPAPAWEAHRKEALDLRPVLVSNHGNRRLILLHRGRTYARDYVPRRLDHDVAGYRLPNFSRVSAAPRIESIRPGDR